MKFIVALLSAACIILQGGTSQSGTVMAVGTFTSDLHTDENRILNNQCSNPLDSASGVSDDNGYSNWLLSKASESYDNYLYFATKSDKCNGMAFHWNILDNGKIQIAVAVKIESNIMDVKTNRDNHGWVGFGFSKVGGMRGADVVYFESASMTLVDAHVGDGYMRPTVDKTQDWTLLHGEKTSDGFLIFEAERDLILKGINHEDHNIVDDSSIYVVNNKIIGSWGNSDTGISYHGKNVIQQTVQLFEDENGEVGNEKQVFKNEMARRAEGDIILKVSDYLIPTDETTYEEFCFTMAELVEMGLYEDVNSSTYVIGLEFVVDEAVTKHVHHMILYGHLTELNENIDKCGFASRRTLAGWAPGQDIFCKYTYFCISL